MLFRSSVCVELTMIEGSFPQLWLGGSGANAAFSPLPHAALAVEIVSPRLIAAIASKRRNMLSGSPANAYRPTETRLI